MGDLRIRRDEMGRVKIRNFPIAVTPEGFWCCPSPAAIQKPIKSQTPQHKHKTSLRTREKNTTMAIPIPILDSSVLSRSANAESLSKHNANKLQRSIQFGKPEMRDLKVVLSDKEGGVVKLSVHGDVLVERSSWFTGKLSRDSNVSVIEVRECDDVELYVEVIGLMYCEDMKQILIKQSVSWVLRVLKIAEAIGFRACIDSCLAHLEAIPWTADDEENVITSVQNLKSNNDKVSPILNRVYAKVPDRPNETISHIIQLVLKSKDEKGRREMKSLVLKLLTESSLMKNGSKDVYVDVLYNTCRSSLESLLLHFRQATEPFAESNDLAIKQIPHEADNILWLLEIKIMCNAAGEFASIWASQSELAALHPKLSVVSRHMVSCIAARLFVGIGEGEIFPPLKTRLALLELWLQPLTDDYNWLKHCKKKFNREIVEEGIGRTILTLPLEEQQRILLMWFSSFLKIGDQCPDLRRAFEVWWKRTFVRCYTE